MCSKKRHDLKGDIFMKYDAAYLKQHLALHDIDATDEDIKNVQHILSMIEEGEKELSNFENLTETKVFLKNDMEVIEHD